MTPRTKTVLKTINKITQGRMMKNMEIKRNTGMWKHLLPIKTDSYNKNK